MVVVDIEGLFDTAKDSDSDMKLAQLAVLLSSYMIFNTVGVIDQTAINQLSLTVEVTKHIILNQPNSSN